MRKLDPKLLLREATGYLKLHPEEIVRVLRGAVSLRVGVPMDAMRYFARELAGGKKAPKDVTIESAPPGIRVGATVEAMGTVIRAKLTLYVEELSVSTEEFKIGVRVEGMHLEVLGGDATSPVAGLIKSGVLDLSKPGNLVAFMPKRPPALVEAKDDRVTVDLLKIPQIAGNPKVRSALRVLTPVVGLRAIKTKDDHLDVHFKANLAGVPAAVSAVRELV
jgi:hypothetical protein